MPTESPDAKAAAPSNAQAQALPNSQAQASSITKEMRIAEAISLCPQAMGIMITRGLHCVGCHISAYETIEEGCRAHGMDDAQIGSLVDEINAAAKSGAVSGSNAGAASSDVIFTPAAVFRLRKIMEAEGKSGFGIRIYCEAKPSAEGSYEMDFEESPKADDEVCDTGPFKVFYQKAIAGSVRGIRIDYRETVSGSSGFSMRRVAADFPLA